MAGENNSGGFTLPNLAALFRPSNAGNSGSAPATATGAPANPAGDGMNKQNPGAGAGTGDNLAPPLENKDPKKDSSPLDSFQDLFKIDDKAQPPANPLAEPLFKIDPKTLAEAVNKMDFAKHINTDLAQKALQGDVPSLQAMLNGSSRAVFMQAVQMLTGVMQNAFNTNNGRFDSILSSRFRDFQVNSSPAQNKALQHPAVQPVLAAIRAQIARQKPTAQAHEIAKEAEDYFLAMGKAMNSVTEENDQNRSSSPGTPKSDDWTKYLETGTTNFQS